MTYLESLEIKDCCGCKSCRDICPNQCITMEADEDGFEYPVIDRGKCRHCHLCELACPQNFENFYSKDYVRAYVGIHKEEKVVYESSSGGGYTALYRLLLSEGYWVYGVKFTEDFRVIHDIAKTEQECAEFRKAKYIYSDTNGCFKKIGEQLKNRKILFSGLPCQCAALRQYLQVKEVDTNNLLIVSTLCHGAPNQKLFNQYKKEIDNLNFPNKLEKYMFRCKDSDGRTVNSRSALLKFADGTLKHVNINEDAFLSAYYSHICFRPSCGYCKFACKDRTSDITLGDAWHIEDIYPEYNPYKGVSLILTATEKGEKVVNDIADIMRLREVDREWALMSQGVMNHPTEVHPRREDFFTLLKVRGFIYAAKKTTNYSITNRFRQKLRMSKVKKRFREIIRFGRGAC